MKLWGDSDYLGVMVACDPALGDGRWSLAVTPTAEALSIELRNLVFRPFVAWLRSTRELDPLRTAAKDSQEKFIVQALEEDRLTLGQIVHLLGDAKRQTVTIGRPLRRWLDDVRPHVLDRLALMESALKQVNAIRTAATHYVGTTEADWRQVYLGTKKALEILVAPERADTV